MKKFIQLNSIINKSSMIKTPLNSISNFNKSHVFKTFCEIKRQTFREKWDLRKFGKIGIVVYLTTSITTLVTSYMLIKYDYFKKQIIIDFLKKKGVDVDHYIEKLGGEKKINFILAYLCILIIKPIRILFSCVVAGAMIQTNKDFPKVKNVKEMISRRRGIISDRLKTKRSNFSGKLSSKQLKEYNSFKGKFNSRRKDIITKFNKKKFCSNLNKNQPKKGMLAQYGKKGVLIYTAYWISSGLFFYYLISNKYIDKEVIEKKIIDYPIVDNYYKNIKSYIGEKNTNIALAYMINGLFEIIRFPTFVMYMRYSIAKSGL